MAAPRMTRVLIADDNNDMRRLLRFIYEREGCTVIEASRRIL